MPDTRTISAVSYKLQDMSSPSQIYDICSKQLVDYNDTDRVGNAYGRLYTVSGVKGANGNDRQMSIGELVMVVCLARATEMEENIINIMANMNDNTNLLNYMSSIENKLLDGNKASSISGEYYYNGVKYTKADEFLKKVLNVSSLPSDNNTLIKDMETKMDSLNSFSQEMMIELQSATNKRDQSYDMITNILKSLNTVMVGIANNV